MDSHTCKLLFIHIQGIDISIPGFNPLFYTTHLIMVWVEAITTITCSTMFIWVPRRFARQRASKFLTSTAEGRKRQYLKTGCRPGYGCSFLSGNQVYPIQLISPNHLITL